LNHAGTGSLARAGIRPARATCHLYPSNPD
jgi:hypothetical protein